MYIAVNTIEVPNPEQMAQMFRMQAGGLKAFKGFVGLELWTDEKNKLKAVTKWENKEAFEAYLSSDAFKHSHGGASGEEKRHQAQVEYYTSEVLA